MNAARPELLISAGPDYLTGIILAEADALRRQEGFRRCVADALDALCAFAGCAPGRTCRRDADPFNGSPHCGDPHCGDPGDGMAAALTRLAKMGIEVAG